MGNETEWAFPARYNKIRENGANDIRLKIQEVCHIRHTFFLAEKTGNTRVIVERYSF